MAEQEQPAKRARQDALLGWLRAQGADCGALELRPDGQGGLGAFAARRIQAGEALAALPASAALSAAAAGGSDLGREVLAAGASEDLALWLCMAQGRDCEAHPWHAYLVSLPDVSPDPTSWPEEALEALRGTPLPGMARDAAALVERELAAVAAKLGAAGSGTSLPSLRRVLWARGVHLSRCFPAALAAPAAELQLRPHEFGKTAAMDGGRTQAKLEKGVEAEGPGCLLPLFDVLNHRAGQPIQWEASEGRITFRALVDLEAGEQVYNNYGGGRSNEELLFYYGFAEAGAGDVRNVVTGFTLECDFDPGARELLAAKHRRLVAESLPGDVVGEDRSTLRLGPFTLGAPPRGGSGADAAAEQSALPPELLRALGIVVAETEDEEPDGISVDALALLHPSLVGSLRAAEEAPPPPSEPVGRAASIQVYCDGRREVLRTALREVETMLASMASSDEDA